MTICSVVLSAWPPALVVAIQVHFPELNTALLSSSDRMLSAPRIQCIHVHTRAHTMPLLLADQFPHAPSPGHLSHALHSPSTDSLQEQRDTRGNHSAQAYSARRRTTRVRRHGRSRSRLRRRSRRIRRHAPGRKREVGAGQSGGVRGVDVDTPVAEKGSGALLSGDVEFEVGGLEGRAGDVAVFA